MCTATWLRRAEGYELFFNRDEARARVAAVPPREGLVGDVRVLAPRDGEAGGTWIAANEHGLSLALLNAETRREPPGEPVSRGLLVLRLAGSENAVSLGARLGSADLSRHLGFRLLAVAPGATTTEVHVWRWDGDELRDEVPVLPLASSSLGSRRAQAARAKILERLGRGGLDSLALERFHASHAPRRGPWSPCVHRPDVVTRSGCHVRVDGGSVRMRYADGSPCTAPFGAPLSLARVSRV